MSLECKEVMEKKVEDAAAYVKAGKFEQAEDMQMLWSVYAEAR